MRLGITEDFYNRMMENANVWFVKAIEIYENHLLNMAGQRYAMTLALQPVVNMGIERLQYYSRLLLDCPDDRDDPETFEEDRWNLLEALKEDLTNPVPQGQFILFK